jgi:hypothetical protein
VRKGFHFPTSSRPALGPTQPPSQWVPGAISSEEKRLGREADHSPLSGAEIKNAWSCSSTPPYVFTSWCSIKQGTSFHWVISLKSRDSSVGIALGYGLDDLGSRARFPVGAGNLSLHHRVQNGSGAHPVQWAPGALSLGVKRSGREADHSLPSSAEVKECVDLYLHSPIRLHGVVLS